MSVEAIGQIKEALDFAANSIKRGDLTKGRAALNWVLERESNNTLALLWMTRCVKSDAAKLKLFQKVDQLDPGNKHALEGIRQYAPSVSQGADDFQSQSPEFGDGQNLTSDAAADMRVSISIPNSITLSLWQTAGFMGCILLALGAFAPLVNFPIVGSISLIQVEYVGVLVITITLGSLLILLDKKKGQLLWISGLAPFGLIAGMLIGVALLISDLRKIPETLASDDSFGGAFAGALFELVAESINLQWGWALLLFGSVLILIAAGLNPQRIGTPKYIAVGVAAGLALPLIFFGRLTLFGGESSDVSGVVNEADSSDPIDLQSPAVMPSAGTSVPALSCEEGAQVFIAEAAPLIEEFGDMGGVAVSTPRIGLGPVIHDMQRIVRDLEGVPVPSCARDARRLLLGGHNKLLDGLLEFMGGASEAQILGVSQQGALDIHNALSQMTALRSGLPTPTPNPLPTQTPVPTPLPTATPMPAGSAFMVDNWQVYVERIEIVDSISFQSDGSTEKAGGRFALLFLSVTNRGLSPDTFNSWGDLIIRDGEGRGFGENIMASFYAQVQYNTDYGASINPDQTEHVVSAFDISTDSDVYLLVPGILAGNSQFSVLLNIP